MKKYTVLLMSLFFIFQVINAQSAETDFDQAGESTDQIYFTITPNPVLKGTKEISFDFSTKNVVEASLSIYNPLGVAVFECTWNHGEKYPVWNLTDKSGYKIPGGSYLGVLWLKFEDKEFLQIKKIIGISN